MKEFKLVSEVDTARVMTPAERKRRQRERKGVVKKVLVELNASDNELLNRCFDQQLGEEHFTAFAHRALILGAKFLANAGVPRGRKVVSKRSSPAVTPSGDT